jgi:hypothetical protein
MQHQVHQHSCVRTCDSPAPLLSPLHPHSLQSRSKLPTCECSRQVQWSPSPHFERVCATVLAKKVQPEDKSHSIIKCLEHMFTLDAGFLEVTKTTPGKARARRTQALLPTATKALSATMLSKGRPVKD